MNARRQRAMSPRTSYCSLRSLLLRVHYESDGGPGIGSIMRLLRDGDNPGEDQHAFITAVITFWLLGAIDGHAKNFSVFLSPGGPLSDDAALRCGLGAAQCRGPRDPPESVPTSWPSATTVITASIRSHRVTSCKLHSAPAWERIF